MAFLGLQFLLTSAFTLYRTSRCWKNLLLANNRGLDDLKKGAEEESDDETK